MSRIALYIARLFCSLLLLFVRSFVFGNFLFYVFLSDRSFCSLLLLFVRLFVCSFVRSLAFGNLLFYFFLLIVRFFLMDNFLVFFPDHYYHGTVSIICLFVCFFYFFNFLLYLSTILDECNYVPISFSIGLFVCFFELYIIINVIIKYVFFDIVLIY